MTLRKLYGVWQVDKRKPYSRKNRAVQSDGND